MHEHWCLPINVGNIDRIFRGVISAGLLVLPVLWAWPGWSIALLAGIGGIQAIASATGY